MGFAFLPVAVGDLVGSPLGGWLSQHYGEELHTPHRMWFVVTGVGLLTTALMMVYHRFVTRTALVPATGGDPG